MELQAKQRLLSDKADELIGETGFDCAATIIAELASRGLKFVPESNFKTQRHHNFRFNGPTGVGERVKQVMEAFDFDASDSEEGQNLIFVRQLGKQEMMVTYWKPTGLLRMGYKIARSE